jgi:hypothetical protein
VVAVVLVVVVVVVVVLVVVVVFCAVSGPVGIETRAQINILIRC